MLNQEVKHRKILVFGLPRTATTVLQFWLAQQHKIDNLVEPYHKINFDNADDIYDWTTNVSNGVIKLLTTNLITFSNLNINKLVSLGFDKVMVTSRKNLTDCCLSLYYAQNVTKKYHYEEDEQVQQILFDVDVNFLSAWRLEMEKYSQTLKQLTDAGIKFEIVDYDYVCSLSKTRKVFQKPFVSTEIDYAKLCTNYIECKQIIDEYEKSLGLAHD